MTEGQETQCCNPLDYHFTINLLLYVIIIYTPLRASLFSLWPLEFCSPASTVVESHPSHRSFSRSAISKLSNLMRLRSTNTTSRGKRAAARSQSDERQKKKKQKQAAPTESAAPDEDEEEIFTRPVFY